MKLIFFRHGTASDKKSTYDDLQDFKRELVKEGIKETKLVEKKFRNLFRGVDVFYSSSYLRAIFTAELLHQKNIHSDFQILPSLDSAVSPKEFIQEINLLSPKKNYCFVGHEPHLSEAVSLLLKAADPIFNLDKSGFVVLEGDHFNNLKLLSMISPKLLNKKFLR